MYYLVATTCLSFCTLGCSLRKLIFEKLSSFKIIEAQKCNILQQGIFRVNVHLSLSTVYFRESIFKKTCIKNARRDFFETLLHTVCCTLLNVWCVLGYFPHVQNFFQIETSLKMGNSRKYPYTTMDGFLEFQGQGGWGFFELEFWGQGEVLWTGRHGGVLTSGILKA